MSESNDVMAILKLYELRRDEKMREARQWYFSEFAPQTALDIVALFRSGERASANFRMITSYWDMAASFVLNGAIDRQIFLDANTEHVFIFVKIEPFLAEIRELFQDPDYLIRIEKLIREMPDVEVKLASRRRLSAIWTHSKPAAIAGES